MNGKDLLIDLGNISQKYYEEAENGNISAIAKYKTFRKPLLIAAIIGLLMLLIGCAAYFYSLQRLVVIDHTKEVIAVVEEDISEDTTETIPETDAGSVVAEQVLSLQGYEGSPAYQA